MKTEASYEEVKDTVLPGELAGLRLFAEADLPAVAALLADCPVKMLSQNETLLTPGAAGQALYFVLRGSLRVHLDSLETEPVQFIEAGEAVGESSLANRKPMSAYVVADAPTASQRQRMGLRDNEDLLGLYEGVPRTERGSYGPILPDKVTIFQRPIEAQCASEDELVEMVRHTVVHELAHHLGISDARLIEIGYEDEDG